MPYGVEFRPRLTNLGEPNIRPNGPNDGETPSTRGTLGIIYATSKEDDAKLHAVYGGKYEHIRLGHTVKVVDRKRGNLQLPVILYWNPRHTCDGWGRNWSSEKLNQWRQGLAYLEKFGAAQFYLDHVKGSIKGIEKRSSPIAEQRPDIDPSTLIDLTDAPVTDSTVVTVAPTLFVNPKDLHYTPPMTTTQPVPTKLVKFTQAQAPCVVPDLFGTIPRPSRFPLAPDAHPNINMMKKRSADSSGGAEQPVKKRKQAPGPSNLRHASPAL